MCSSRRGLLLVEAVLSAVIIGTGLVVISRGLAGQLRALSTVDQYETLRLLAASRLAQLETDLLAGRLAGEREGPFAPPHDAYRWELTVSARRDGAGGADLADITLTIRRADRAQSFQVPLVWPSQWLPPAWI